MISPFNTPSSSQNSNFNQFQNPLTQQAGGSSPQNPFNAISTPQTNITVPSGGPNPPISPFATSSAPNGSAIQNQPIGTAIPSPFGSASSTAAPQGGKVTPSPFGGVSITPAPQGGKVPPNPFGGVGIAPAPQGGNVPITPFSAGSNATPQQGGKVPITPFGAGSPLGQQHQNDQLSKIQARFSSYKDIFIDKKPHDFSLNGKFLQTEDNPELSESDKIALFIFECENDEKTTHNKNNF